MTVESSARSSGLMAFVAMAALVLCTVAFRVPPLINAAGIHSDAAIVGLQARHMLYGEYSPFLWGAGYQGSLDAVFLALGFAVFGATPLSAMAVPLVGHLVLVGCVFGILRRYLSAPLAALASVPVIFTPQAINGVVLYAPRQFCLTFIFVGLWLVDGAARSRSYARFGLGVGLLVGSLYLDLYGLQFLPAAGVFTLLCAFDAERRWTTVLARLASAAAGLAAGGLAVWLPRQSELATAAPTGWSLAHAKNNFPLLWDTCLPWVLGYKVFVPGRNLYPDLWEAPAPVRYFQLFGAATLGLFIVSGAVWLFVRRVPWPLRRLGVFALVATATTIGGFLVSGMPYDMWAARYLAPMVWTAPFALGAVAFALGKVPRVALAFLPYAAVAALGGWLSYGPYVEGPLPVRDPRGQAQDEQKVAEFLRSRGVAHAAAQYWLAYRLGFLFEERPVVVPIDPGQDRYGPYRAAFMQAPVVAYVFHPSEPRAQVGQWEPVVRAQPGTVERVEVAGFSILVHQRPP